MRESFGIKEVVRDPGLPRLLVIRVGPEWDAVPAERRRAAAAEWERLWRQAVPQGIVAVLDKASDQPLVNFGADRQAILLRRPSGAPTPDRQ